MEKLLTISKDLERREGRAVDLNDTIRLLIEFYEKYSGFGKKRLIKGVIGRGRTWLTQLIVHHQQQFQSDSEVGSKGSEENDKRRKNPQLLLSLLGSASGLRDELRRSRAEDEKGSY